MLLSCAQRAPKGHLRWDPRQQSTWTYCYLGQRRMASSLHIFIGPTHRIPKVRTSSPAVTQPPTHPCHISSYERSEKTSGIPTPPPARPRRARCPQPRGSQRPQVPGGGCDGDGDSRLPDSALRAQPRPPHTARHPQAALPHAVPPRRRPASRGSADR